MRAHLRPLLVLLATLIPSALWGQSDSTRELNRAVSAVATYANVDHPLTTEPENPTRAAVLIVTSWMGLVSAGIMFAWGHGASWPLALAVAALINLVAAGVLGWLTLKLAKELPFTALLRQLRGDPPEPPQRIT